MPDPIIEVIGPNQYKVTIQVNFWERANNIVFDRAECWEEMGVANHDGTHYGACVFSIIADVEPMVAPEPPEPLLLGSLLLLVLGVRRAAKSRPEGV